MISSTICSTIVSCRVGRVGSVRSGQAGQSSQSGLSGPTDRPGAWAIVVTFLGHDTCCRVESSGCHILKIRLDNTNYPGRWACKFHCYCNASWTFRWWWHQGRLLCRFHCYCNTSWTLPLPVMPKKCHDDGPFTDIWDTGPAALCESMSSASF